MIGPKTRIAHFRKDDAHINLDIKLVDIPRNTISMMNNKSTVIPCHLITFCDPIVELPALCQKLDRAAATLAS